MTAARCPTWCAAKPRPARLAELLGLEFAGGTTTTTKADGWRTLAVWAADGSVSLTTPSGREYAPRLPHVVEALSQAARPAGSRALLELVLREQGVERRDMLGHSLRRGTSTPVLAIRAVLLADLDVSCSGPDAVQAAASLAARCGRAVEAMQVHSGVQAGLAWTRQRGLEGVVMYGPAEARKYRHGVEGADSFLLTSTLLRAA